ncbi:unnamed protein product, partial [Rotaria sp. Silwood2]
QVKQKLTFNQSSKEETKKLRIDFNRLKTSIKDVSNEFFYEIFDYLYGNEIVEAFSNLNYSFQEIHNSSCSSLNIRLGASGCGCGWVLPNVCVSIIVADLQADKTNLLLQALAEAINSNVDNNEVVRKTLQSLGDTNENQKPSCSRDRKDLS